MVDGDLTNDIIITGNVDKDTLGEYFITYTVRDSWDNIATIQRKVIVQKADQEAPVLTLNGDNPLILNLNQEYQEPGATAIDDNDGDISHNIIISGNVDVTTPGTYLITYSIKDSANNETSKERVVKVNANSSISVARRNAIRRRRLRELEKQKQLEEEKERGGQEQLDFAEQNPAEEKEKEAEKPPVFLLTSSCLSLKSERSYLSKGLNLPEIQTLQNFLKSQGYLKINNTTTYFGNLTQKALQEFQEDNHITPASGIFGRITARSIDQNCNNLKTKEEVERERREEEGKEKEKEQEETKQDFAPQNPAEKVNIEENKRIVDAVLVAPDTTLDRLNSIVSYERLNLELERDKNYKNFKKEIKNFDLRAITSMAKTIWNEAELIYFNLKGDDKAFKLYGFKIYSNTANDEVSDNSKETFIIMHGWKSEPIDWVQDIASYLPTNSQILLVDWKDVTHNLNIIEDTKNTDEVSKKLAEILRDWKVDNKKVTIIGHSMGAMASSRLAHFLGGNVKEIISLDVAELLGTSYSFKMDHNGTEFPGFENTANNVKCFVGSKSLFGKENVLGCDEKISINFPLTEIEHIGVHKIYRRIINDRHFYKNYLSFRNQNDKIPKAMIIAEKEKGELINKYLKVEKDKDADIYYGTEKRDSLACRKLKGSCYIYGWKEQDKFKVFSYPDYFKSSLIVQDLAQGDSGDKIIISSLFLKKIWEPEQFGTYVRIPITYYTNNTNGSYYTKFLFIKGVKKKEVVKWIEDARNEDGLLDEEDYKKLPIQIE